MEYILEIDNVFSKEFCEDVISRFEGDERKVIGSTVGGVDEKIKKSMDLPISTPDLRGDWQDVIDQVGNRVIKALINYQEHVHIEGLDRCSSIHKTINNATIGFPQIQRTSKDGFYTWHHDSYLNRIFTYIIYLNDVEEGVGGTTEFLCGKHVQPKTGKLVLFPATLTYVHRGTKLKNGVKYLITNFVYEGVPIHRYPSDVEVKSVEEKIPEPENDDI
jgi:hypothetical protein